MVMSAEDALTAIISAWDSLPRDLYYTEEKRDNWLVWDMRPAIDNARKVLENK